MSSQPTTATIATLNFNKTLAKIIQNLPQVLPHVLARQSNMKKNISSKTNKKPKAQNIGNSFSFLLPHLFVATSEEVRQIAGIAEQQSWHEFPQTVYMVAITSYKIYGIWPQANKQTYTHACAQCSPASVGLAQVWVALYVGSYRIYDHAWILDRSTTSSGIYNHEFLRNDS